jgi:hypothetical protein
VLGRHPAWAWSRWTAHRGRATRQASHDGPRTGSSRGVGRAGGKEGKGSPRRDQRRICGNGTWRRNNACVGDGEVRTRRHFWTRQVLATGEMKGGRGEDAHALE